MPQASLTTDYLTALSAQLPPTVVEELADGLGQTQQRYLSEGLTPDAAAGAAMAEFGERGHRGRLYPAEPGPARCAQAAGRRAAGRRVLGGSAYHRPGLDLASARRRPDPVWCSAHRRDRLGLAAAAFGRRYRSARRCAGAAGCAGITALDSIMLITVMVAIPVLIWPVILAAAASAARLTFSARALRAVLTG